MNPNYDTDLKVEDMEGDQFQLIQSSDDETKTLENLIQEHGVIIKAYYEEVGGAIDYLEDSFLEAYQGEYDSWEDFAERLLDECGDLKDLPSLIRNNIDWNAIGNELSYDYFEIDGHFFRNI